MAHALLTWETGHRRIRQFQLEFAIQRVDQLILRFEVGKQRAFRNSGRTRNGCRRSTQSALRENLRRGGKDRVAFIFALRFSQPVFLLLSIYSSIEGETSGPSSCLPRQVARAQCRCGKRVNVGENAIPLASDHAVSEGRSRSSILR